MELVAALALLVAILGSFAAFRALALAQDERGRRQNLEGELCCLREDMHRDRRVMEELAAAAGFKRASLVVQPTWERKL